MSYRIKLHTEAWELNKNLPDVFGSFPLQSDAVLHWGAPSWTPVQFHKSCVEKLWKPPPSTCWLYSQ